MTTIYHNPRCSKSRETLEILEQKEEQVKIVRYLEEVPSKLELRSLIKMLGITASDLVRKNEPIWKEQYKGKDLSDAEILAAMVVHPKLIERPIVVKNGRAVIGRPPEIINTIL